MSTAGSKKRKSAKLSPEKAAQKITSFFSKASAAVAKVFSPSKKQQQEQTATTGAAAATSLSRTTPVASTSTLAPQALFQTDEIQQLPEGKSTKFVSFEGLLSMSIEQLKAIIADAKNTKVAKKGAIIGGCWTQTYQTGPKKGQPYDTYPDHNTTAYHVRLHQVGGALFIKEKFPNLTIPTILAFDRRFKGQCSHLCRFEATATITEVDDSTYPITILRENKACFNPAHIVYESEAANDSRKQCSGGDQCSHKIKCLIVKKPM